MRAGEVTVPGTLPVTMVGRGNPRGSGFLLLVRGTVTRRIPFWYCRSAARLRHHGYGTLKHTGTFSGDSKRRRALVARYRFPELQGGAGIPTVLRGPEQVFRVRVRRRPA